MTRLAATRRRLVAGAAAALAFTLAAPGSFAQAPAERTLRFAFSQSKDSPFGQGAQKFAEAVARNSGGKLKVTLFPSAVLGGDTQNLSAVRAGTLDLTSMATGLVASLDKQFLVFDLPFLFNNAQEAFALADGPVGQKMLGDLAPHGIVGLGIWDLGFRNMTNSKRPIAKAEDVQGLKIRVISSPIYLDIFSTLGANPVPMSFGEVYGALESRAIDGQDNPVSVIESAKFAEVQKFLSLTRHVYTGMPLLMSKKTFDALTETQRAAVRTSAVEATQEERKINLASEAAAIDGLKKSMQINDISASELDRLRQKLQPVVDKFSREAGEGVYKQTTAELARLRSAK